METMAPDRFVSLAEAKKIAREVADYLRREYGATKVLLFGSAVEGNYVTGHSDIDIYFEGVPKECELWVLGDVLDKFPYAIDYRPAGLCHKEFRDAVLRMGVVI
ncbi:MAG: nucleotidyltransferase domain-containing protein [Verrucomicrobiales bacterium]|jgi:predicted nucleotidyltransferase|nr:nucleotidyltransferase domain-containing protein [Verrucomicrobiales bacterium]